MNLKVEMELLRGKPYPKPPTDDALACEEISDVAWLCQAPLVSVIMITYNHEPYIREAVESIMAQDAPFEYELLLGEDLSSDGTRSIAKQLQGEFPDRIRLFYSDCNIGWNYNIERLRRRVRGKYIAWCEGDDYWTDTKKLAKQVAMIERTNTVVNVAFYKMFESDGRMLPQVCNCPEVMDYDQFPIYFHFSTYLIRSDVLSRAHQDYPEIPEWYDTVMMPILSTYGKISVLPEIVSVYRITKTGIATSLSGRQKRIRGIDQSVASYLYGPDQNRTKAMMSIFRESALYFYLKSSGGSLRTQEGRLVMSLFLHCLPCVFFRCHAWRSIVYILLSQIGIRHSA